MDLHQDLLSYEKALALVLKRAELRRREGRLQAVDLPLASCLGRVLAVELRSPEVVPSFANSQMDGFAIEARSTAGASAENPLELSIFGTIAAGDGPRAVRGGGAYEITTGAMMPGAPYDAVVKVEDIRFGENSEGRTITISQAYAPGNFIRKAGEDFQVGQRLAPAGEIVSPQLIMACASLGIAELKVHEPIRLAVLGTGTELQRYSDGDLREGAIRDASGPYLDALMQNPIFELVAHKLVPDDPEMFAAELNLCLELQPDVILSTGAVSMGRHDFVHEVIKGLGGQSHFHKVAIRPGKPILFAEWGESASGPVLFGLPGNPISTLIGWRFFASPYFRALLGIEQERPRWARLAQAVQKPQGLMCFFKAKMREEDACLTAEVLAGQGSHLISPLLETDVWAVLPSDATRLEAGALLATYRLHSQESYS